ncbi:hypothetical protein OG884_04495 [Streptosporangium sp. NBC_01755]|uniref:hypothetical protein n=1 Tax=Streptosporangium sp. NBC_01755 TaxID=2975949 RepID=UPI002DDBD2E2|nr:hypothetical protein [Streptosporangium sp. NBC_01755]WSD01200.1 hypothetical protein OG884_04495 [Streptosporangium sp. NBC_01755]
MLTLLAALSSSAAGASPVTTSPVTTGLVTTGPVAADPHGTIGIRLLEAPVSHRNDPRALSYIVDHLHPGTTIQRKLEVSNTSRRAQHISLYPASADIVRNAFSAPPGQVQNELASWMSLDRPSIDVAPGAKEIAQVTIKVPPAASRGERYGVVWAESMAESDDANPVRVINRVGIRVYLDVGSGGEPPSDFRIENLTPKRAPDGSPQLEVLIRNTGKRTLDMSGTLSLSDGPSGLQAGPFPADLGVTLLPGSAAPVSVTLDKQVPDGPWKVRLTLMSGMVKRMVTATVTFPATGTGSSVTPDQDYLPLAGLIAGLVVLPATVLGFAVRRRRRAVSPAS